MATIPQATKNHIKKPGVRFNRAPESETPINEGLLAVAKRAIGNAIMDSEPYTIRINFRNGRIVGSEANPRLSVELLNGLSPTSIIGVPSENAEVFLELESLVIEGSDAITNGDSWVARVKMNGNTVTSVFVNHDFSEEDRKLIETVLYRGFGPQIQF